jgi:hypothetical protein
MEQRSRKTYFKRVTLLTGLEILLPVLVSVRTFTWAGL